MRIGINCGHTVSGQPGCGAVDYIDESAETRNVGKRLMTLLREAGHAVYDCTNDYAPSTSSNLLQIVNMANAHPLDLFVSIHFNAGGGNGCEVYTYGGVKHTEAVSVCNALLELGFVNRGVKDGSKQYVIRHSEAKAMLVEVCFVDTQSDVDLYKSLGAERIAKAICEAITGDKATNPTDEYTKTNDIIWELNHRGIISDIGLWTSYCNNDSNIYWFCRKLCHYIRTKTTTEYASNEYDRIHDIAWDLNYREIISDISLWENYMNKDKNMYWLLRKSLHYCRTH